MVSASYEVRREAERLLSLPATQARHEFGSRVARAFALHIADPVALASFVRDLDFNARLATELRVQAKQRGDKTIWEIFG